MLRVTIRDSDKDYEVTLFPDGRAIVKGTDEPTVARSVFAKYVGA
jgi:adenylyltransferase/sulfurtransferase